jgi:hypothetical protein
VPLPPPTWHARVSLLRNKKGGEREHAVKIKRVFVKGNEHSLSHAEDFMSTNKLLTKGIFFFFFYISLNQKITKITKNLQGTSVIETAHKKKKTRQTERVKVKS